MVDVWCAEQRVDFVFGDHLVPVNVGVGVAQDGRGIEDAGASTASDRKIG